MAVLLVLGYHAFPGTVKAGFIGVDIFFVISGYLIGGIILTNLQAHEFSYRNFYYRRILRIFPALIVVFLGVLLAGYIFLFPDELKNLGSHVLAGGLFCENFLLWHSTGYFATAAHTKPLLNLWSLGIEEQFYIIFPLLLACCWKKGLRIFSILAILALVSLMACVRLSHLDPAADFYSPFTRFWELLAGSLLKAAEMYRRYGAAKEKINKIFSGILYREFSPSQNGLGIFLVFLGVFLVGFAFLRSTPQSPYPGWLALFPVGATLCLIIAGPANPISQYLFCNRLAVYIGKISYPLYLWHWPLLSFAWILNGHLDSSTRLLRLELLLAAFVLASLTYFLVERPVRFRHSLGRASMPLLVGGMVFCCCLGFAVYYCRGLPERATLKKYEKILQALTFPEYTNEAGLKYIESKGGDFDFCLYTDAGQEETVALLGDSHAYTAYHGIANLGAKLANDEDGRGYNTLCLAYAHPVLFANGGSDYPERFKKFVDIISEHPEIKKVFLSNFSTIVINAFGYEKFKKLYEDCVNELLQMGKEVIIIAENPQLKYDFRSAIIRGTDGILINNERLKLLKKEIQEKERQYIEILADLGKKPLVDVIYTNDIFCPGEECLALDEHGLPLYLDDNHLSKPGSDFQAQRIIRPWLEKKHKEEREKN